MSLTTRYVKGKAHHAWKGRDVGYNALHSWVSRSLGEPQSCSKCGDTSNRRYHWANVSGRYYRDLDDWVRLCPSCHKKLDITPETRARISRSKSGVPNPKKCKAVRQFDREGRPLNSYPSFLEASRVTGVLGTSICNNIKGLSKSAGGFTWKLI